MSNSIRKIIKYIAVVGVLGAIVFFGVRILYPTPSSTLAFEKTVSIIENEGLEKNHQATEDFVVKFASQFSDEEDKIVLLQHSKDLTLVQIDALNIMVNHLMFAKNSPVYNSNANKLNALEGNVAKSVDEASQYIDNQVQPVLNQTTSPSKSILNALVANLTKNSKEIANNLTQYIDAITAIYIDLDTTFLTNNYSKKIMQIVSIWISTQNSFLNDSSYYQAEDYTNIKGSMNFSKLYAFQQNMATESNFLSYNSNKISFEQTLTTFTKANISGLTKAIEVVDVNDFIASIENQEIKASTENLKNFIMGGI